MATSVSWATYRRAFYRVNVRGEEIEIRVGKRTPALDGVLAREGKRRWTFITACNPGARLLGAVENRVRTRALKSALRNGGFLFFAGKGGSDSGDWPEEESFLVVGIGQSEADRLRRRFRQDAIVTGTRGGVARLWPRSAELPLTPRLPLDVVIIGAGQAGIPLAHALAKAGKRVAIAERKDLGGSCVNFGCTPTKAVIASARAAYIARRAAVFGLRVPKVEIDFPAVLDRARSILMYSRARIRRSFEESDNPRLVRGHARLEGREGRLFKVRIGKVGLRARQVVLDTGTRSDLGSIVGLESVPFLHASNWLDQNELPRHILFAGGGYIALEMGQFYRRMGSRVTIVDGGDQILKWEDRDIAERLQHLLESEGIQFRLNCHVTRVSPRRGGLAATVEKDGAREVFAASHFFVSAGRRANTDDLGLETVGLKPGAHGILAVDERLATSVPGIWAAGDIRGWPMFTHTSWDDHRILLSQLVGDGKRTTRRIVPYAVYTDPELGRVGATEEELRKAGRDIRVGRFEMRGNGKALERSETRGCIKVVTDAKTEKLLGASVLASDGAELVHVYVALMNANVSVNVLRDAIQIHPTLSEALQSAVGTLA